MNHNIELNYDQMHQVTRNVLIEMLYNEGNPELREALHKVIAFMSVPGTYCKGKYDLESYVNEEKYATED